MSKTDIMSLIFTLIFALLVIGFVFIAFLIIYKYEKKETEEGENDADVIEEVKPATKKGKAFKWIGRIASWLFDAVCVAFIAFCVYAKVAGTEVWIFGQRALVIETGSMSSLNSGNPMKVKGKTFTDAMIAQEFTTDDLVVVGRFDSSSAPASSGRSVYTYRSPKDGSTVIHRLWDVGTVDVGGSKKTVCFFVGDANTAPDDYSSYKSAWSDGTDKLYNLTATWTDPLTDSSGNAFSGCYVYAEDITGVYSYKMENAGNLIRFAQSSVGLETGICILIIVAGCSFFQDKVAKLHDERMKAIAKENEINGSAAAEGEAGLGDKADAKQEGKPLDAGVDKGDEGAEEKGKPEESKEAKAKEKKALGGKESELSEEDLFASIPDVEPEQKPEKDEKKDGDESGEAEKEEKKGNKE